MSCRAVVDLQSLIGSLLCAFGLASKGEGLLSLRKSAAYVITGANIWREDNDVQAEASRVSISGISWV